MSPSEFGNGAKSSPGRLIGTCHLSRTVAFLARAFALALIDPIRRALKKLYGATLISIMLKILGKCLQFDYVPHSSNPIFLFGTYSQARTETRETHRSTRTRANLAWSV